MKKTVISFILIIFLFNMFYPAIYATENILTDEEVEVKEESAEQENVEEPEVEKKEEVSIEEKISEIDETSKVELKEESNEILEDNDASVKTEELKEALKEDSETDENIEEIENSNIENLKEEVKENKEEKIITQVPEIDTNIGVSYNGKMYIETPNNGTKFTLPDNNTLKVKGWAVSNDDKVVLKVYIDNKYIKNIEKRYKRADVDKNITGYGGTAKTPNAGFQEQVSISGLSAGNHALKIEQVSNTGVIICSETRNIVITQKAFSGEMYVETPSQTASYILPDNKTMLIKGWAVSDDIGAFMLVSIDGSLAKFSTQRTSRKDVDKTISVKYGGTKTTSKAGFMLDVDISKLSVGVHDVWITQISRYQKIMCQRNVKIKISHKKYEGKINIESPNDNMQFLLPESNNITIRGWAVSDDSSAVLKLYIDNQFKQNIDKRINRNDVNKSFSKYGGTKTTPKAGFEICADVYNLSEGNHTIKVEQVSNQGNVICSETKTIKIKHTRYKGKMNIETPNPMSTYNLLDTKNMQIKGWAVSDDIGVYMIVDINGKKANYTTTRIVRKDVDKSVSPSYGGTKATPKAGFILDVDISNLADGIYDITVKQVSRYHQVLVEQNMKIYIKTPSYNGCIYVESPIHNKKYNSSELEIKGWALSNDKNDSIKVYLDGKYITNAERMARPDVLNSYKGQFGGKEANKFPGFYSKLNIANLSEGTHTVKISIFSKYGREIKSSQTTIMITNTKTWGIDVSHYQEDIDWNTVRNQGINFAILKIGEYRESSGRVIKDSKFEQNYIACKNNGIAVGGYFYSYAFDPTEASHEAAACLSIISGKSFELPIFLDIEDDLIKNAVNTGRTNQANLTNGAITFCNIMNQSGYKSGVYASKNFYQTYLYTPLLETYNIWLAHYTSATNYTGKYDIWQYTSNGSLAGIRGAVDLNWCFRKY